MSSLWRRAMLYLGLGPDDEYDDYDPQDEPVHAQGYVQGGTRYPPQPAPAPLPEPVPDHQPIGTIRTISPQVESSAVVQKPRPAVVRPIPASASAKPHVVSPTSFNEAQELADKFKGSQPVIMNLQGVDRDLSRRLIDFASGLCYGLGGQMERVAGSVYLLTPTNVEVSAEERRRLHERGLYD
ncbi:MAG TPA: cell division protein SepF [Acidimicrobiales bacterium]